MFLQRPPEAFKHADAWTESGGGCLPLRGYVRGVLSEAKSRAALRICKADSNAPKTAAPIRRYPLNGASAP